MILDGKGGIMANIKRFGHLISSILLYALLMILLVVVLMVGATVVDHFVSSNGSEKKSPLFGAYVIISPSMVPNINVYDAVVTIRSSKEKIEMYDVITFLSKDIETHGIPMLGYVRTFVTSKIGFLVAIVLPLVSSFTIEILRAIKKKKEVSSEDIDII